MTEKLTGQALRDYVWRATTGPFGAMEVPLALGFAVMYGLCDEVAAQEYLHYFQNTVHRNTDRASATGTGNG